MFDCDVLSSYVTIIRYWHSGKIICLLGLDLGKSDFHPTMYEKQLISFRKFNTNAKRAFI